MSGELSRQNYGVPLYGAGWVPPAVNLSEISENGAVILAGGGGEGHSGVPNALVVAKIDSESLALSSQPVARLETGSDLPYRIAIHPGGEGVVCSFPQSCRLFEWDQGDDHALNLRSSERVLEQLEDVGQQLALTFNSDGTLLAVGGEDGKLKVFKWPSMESVLSNETAHSSRVKDLDFSSDGKFLASLGSGPGRVWDINQSTSVASLPEQRDEVHAFCRFSRSTDHVLYTATIQGNTSRVLKWDTNSGRRISSTIVVRDAVSAFNVSPDGKLLAMGTIQGDVLIINSSTLRVQAVVKKAHIGLATSLAFSSESRFLLSASMDSTARITPIRYDQGKSGVNLWIVLVIILLAVAAYYFKVAQVTPSES